MICDPELIAAHRELGREHMRLVRAHEDLDRAERTLKQAGYTDCGGELWRPPIGPKPEIFTADECNIVSVFRKLKPGECTMIQKPHEIYDWK